MKITDELIQKVATAIANEAIRQNHMLESWTRENDGKIGFFDDYDNKFYDCEELARIALEASGAFLVG